MSNRLFSAQWLTQASLVAAATLSIAGLSGCSSGSTSGGSGDQANNTSGGESNARDLFYHDLKNGNAAQASASGSSSGSSDGSAAAAGSGGGKLAAAFCWESRIKELGPAAILSHDVKIPYKQGDGVRFHFRPSTQCYAYLVMFKGSSGKDVTILFPSSPSQDGAENKLDAGKEYAVPANGMLEFDNTPGQEVVGFVLMDHPLSSEKAAALCANAPPVDMGTVAAGRAIQSGPMSLFASSDQSVPATDYKQPDRGDASHDPFVYIDNSKDPTKPIVIPIPFTHK